LSDYPVRHYILAVLLGRIPRFLFLAVGGKLLNVDNKLIIFVFILVIFVYLSAIIYKNITKTGFLIYEAFQEGE